MKKYILLIMVLCLAMVAKAQNEVTTATLQHGDEVSVFTGVNALVNAHEAAANGDVITLSAGNFAPITMTKSVSIYGAGFEKDETAGTNVTRITGQFGLGNGLTNAHIEGLYLADRILASTDNDVSDIVIAKCYIASNGICFNKAFKNVTLSNDVVIGSVYTNYGALATNLVINNCYIENDVSSFSAESTVLVDHCIIAGNGGPFTFKNTIFSGGIVGVDANAVAYNCLAFNYRGLNSTTNKTDCYLLQYNAEIKIFEDSPNTGMYGSGKYSPERTFELTQPETWVGTDGTEIGIRGGAGWSKLPSTPVVKSLQLNVEGKTLKVNYDAEVR